MRAGEFLTLDVYKRGVEEHKQIAQAIIDGDTQKAMELMRDHLTSAFGDLAKTPLPVIPHI